MGLLRDKIAIITGASRGIGKATAEVFVREGAQVVLCGRKQETLDRVAHELGPAAKPVACHIGKIEQIESLVETTTREFGRIDILVNNAGTNIGYGWCLDMDDSQFDKMVELNLKSVFRLMRLVAPGMCQRGVGSIVNIASTSGMRPQRHSLLYSMVKAALLMLTQSYALELGPKGVRVNSISPGLIQTQLSEVYWKDEGHQAEFIRRQALPRIGQPMEVAEAVLLLASDRGSFITGQTIIVDGGYVLNHV